MSKIRFLLNIWKKTKINPNKVGIFLTPMLNGNVLHYFCLLYLNSVTGAIGIAPVYHQGYMLLQIVKMNGESICKPWILRHLVCTWVAYKFHPQLDLMKKRM